MPWFRQPLTFRVRQPDPNGPIRVSIRARIDLEIERSPGDWLQIESALIDTGASFVILSAAWARRQRIPVPSAVSVMPLITVGGNRNASVRDADLRVRFGRLREYPFVLAVVYSEDYPPTAPPLIGLHNLLNFWRFTFDGAPDPAAIMGHMRFEIL
jgi:hypothetical protein